MRCYITNPKFAFLRILSYVLFLFSSLVRSNPFFCVSFFYSKLFQRKQKQKRPGLQTKTCHHGAPRPRITGKSASQKPSSIQTRQVRFGNRLDSSTPCSTRPPRSQLDASGIKLQLADDTFRGQSRTTRNEAEARNETLQSRPSQTTDRLCRQVSLGLPFPRGRNQCFHLTSRSGAGGQMEASVSVSLVNERVKKKKTARRTKRQKTSYLSALVQTKR